MVISRSGAVASAVNFAQCRSAGGTAFATVKISFSPSLVFHVVAFWKKRSVRAFYFEHQ